MAGQPNFPELPDDAVAPDSALVSWRSFRRALAYLRAITPLPGKGIQLSEDAQGVRIAARPPAPGEAGAIINPGFLVQNVGSEDDPVARIWGGVVWLYTNRMLLSTIRQTIATDPPEPAMTNVHWLPNEVSGGSADSYSTAGELKRFPADLELWESRDEAFTGSGNFFVYLELRNIRPTFAFAANVDVEIKTATTEPTTDDPYEDHPSTGESLGERDIVLAEWDSVNKRFLPRHLGPFFYPLVIGAGNAGA